MAEYASVKKGSLNLKGGRGSSFLKKKKRKKGGSDDIEEWMREPGAIKHGKWRRVRSFEEIKDRVILEMHTGQYLQALDNGYFALGDIRTEEDGPDDAEIFTLVVLSERKVALKSGYGRYIGVNTAGEVIGKSEAIAAREQWEPVFENVTNPCVFKLCSLQGKITIPKLLN
jgi:protein FRG1